MTPPLERDEPLILGSTQGLQPAPVLLPPQELTRHAAFLGGSGSGKTTLALNVVEQLLLRGVPALVIDRKGDLGGYARPEVWTQPLDGERAAQREQLRGRVDVALYTPGHPDGRPLSIALLPANLEELPSADREQLARFAAVALGGMMGYKEQKQSDAARLAVLAKALELVAEMMPSAEVTLDHLLQVIDGPDPGLLAAIGRLDPKLCRPLVQDLETLRA